MFKVKVQNLDSSAGNLKIVIRPRDEIFIRTRPPLLERFTQYAET